MVWQMASRGRWPSRSGSKGDWQLDPDLVETENRVGHHHHDQRDEEGVGGLGELVQEGEREGQEK